MRQPHDIQIGPQVLERNRGPVVILNADKGWDVAEFREYLRVKSGRPEVKHHVFRRLIEHIILGLTTKLSVREPSSSRSSRQSSNDSAERSKQDPGSVSSVNWSSKLPFSISVQR
jgi:hypothetical protein